LLKRNFAIVLAGILLSTSFGFQPVNARTTEDSRRAESARLGVLKLGVGRDARIEVKLTDNTRLKGFVSQADDNSFIVTDLKTGASRTVVYPDATQVKGNNLSTKTKVIIGVAAAVAAGIVLFMVRGAFCDGQC
jgi:hypothetical protein